MVVRSASSHTTLTPFHLTLFLSHTEISRCMFKQEWVKGKASICVYLYTSVNPKVCVCVECGYHERFSFFSRLIWIFFENALTKVHLVGHCINEFICMWNQSWSTCESKTFDKPFSEWHYTLAHVPNLKTGSWRWKWKRKRNIKTFTYYIVIMLQQTWKSGPHSLRSGVWACARCVTHFACV